MAEICRAPDGTRIAFTIDGSGPPLLLLHGITESRHSWDPLVPRLATRHTVVAVDLRGHGESDLRPPYDAAACAADVGAVAAAAGLENPAIIGHSLGAAVATIYAAAGGPCSCAVNVDQPLRLSDFKAALEPLGPSLREQGTFRQAVEAVFSALEGPLPASEKARIDLHRSIEQDVVLGVWATVLDSSAEELDALAAATLAAVKVPYLSLHGDDPGDAYAGWLHELLPAATLEVWPGQGHYPHLVSPDRFVDRVEAFIAAGR